MQYDYSDQVILITGASKGIGRSLAKEFALQRAYVIANYFTSEIEARSLKKWSEKNKLNLELFKADVREEKEVKTMYHTLKHQYGGIDILINNAGICDDNRVTMMSFSQWENVIETNLTAVFLCSKYFSRTMILNRKGKILNIASIKGQEGMVGQCNYSASKAGVIALTKTLAKELCNFGIAVNAICPGYMVTDLNRDNESKKKIAKEKSLLGIEYSESDLLAVTNLLLSKSCNGISGRVFNVDSRIR